MMVAHDRKEMVFESLSLLLSFGLFNRVVVVDNVSGDNLSVDGPSQFLGVKWIVLKQNIGCAAWNTGMAETISEYALILDDDCVPDPSSVESALSTLKKSESLGLGVFNVLNRYSMESEWGYMEDNDGTSAWANAIGACMMVRVDAFFKAGGYKDYFLCFNDTDLVLSLWEVGHEVVYNRNWRAFHAKTPNRIKNRRFYYEVRNLLWTVWTHVNILQALVISIKYLAGSLYDAKKIADYYSICKALGKGLTLGLYHRRRRTGKVPNAVLSLFYRNFILSDRIPRFLNRAFSELARSGD